MEPRDDSAAVVQRLRSNRAANPGYPLVNDSINDSINNPITLTLFYT
jgi:hypothetical protein